MKLIKLAALTILLGLSLGSAQATDVEKGKALAVNCGACHGENGISHSPFWPNLAGQKAAYLEKQLKDFRGDIRQDPMMSAMAKPLSDEDIKALAAYYASLQ